MKKHINTWELVDQYLENFSLPASLTSNAMRILSNKQCFSKGQLCSKFWLSSIGTELGLFDNRSVCIAGGWYGVLACILRRESSPKNIHTFDIDPMCEDTIYKLIPLNSRPKASTADMYVFDYSPYDVVINTSFEHIEPERWSRQTQDYKGIIIIQSNNYYDAEGHINCINSIDELAKQVNFKTTLYKGTLVLPEYERYMIIGKVTA